MKVSEVMTRDVRVCLPTEPLTRAAKIMWEQDCGCVPVVSSAGRPIAMITDRDVCMAAYTRGNRLDEVPVERAMSTALFTCRDSDDVETAARAMRQHRVRRLPVLDKGGQIVGLVSSADLVRAAAQALPQGKRTFADELLSTLGEIVQTRCPIEASQPSAPARPARKPKETSAT